MIHELDMKLIRTCHNFEIIARDSWSLLTMTPATTTTTTMLSVMLAIVAAIIVHHFATADDIALGLLHDKMPRAVKATSATQPCPTASSNRIRTTWMAPTHITKEEACKTVRVVLEAYPQGGQGGIDRGGWNLEHDEERFHVEYSSGKGFFARLLNAGKPFLDDVWVEVVMATVTTPITVELRSSSRLGKSDLGVNRKRLQFLANEIRKQGWDAPEPKYA